MKDEWDRCFDYFKKRKFIPRTNESKKVFIQTTLPSGGKPTLGAGNQCRSPDHSSSTVGGPLAIPSESR